MYDLTVVIATHNRPQFLFEAITSVLKQTYYDFYFVISDNSDNNDAFEVLEKELLLNKIKYKKRNNLLPMDHFNLILEEIDTKYFILFHDDDVMLPEMVGALYKAISNDAALIAVGCNCYYLFDDKISQATMLRSDANLFLANQEEMVMRYCNGGEIAPFPSYIYNAKLIKKNRIFFTNYAGKYSDVIWLLELKKIGKIQWLSEPLMFYRIHKDQESSQFSYFYQQKLTQYCSKILNNGKKNSVIKNYRLQNLYTAMVYRLKNKQKLSLFIIRQMALLLAGRFVYYLKPCIRIIILYIIEPDKL